MNKKMTKILTRDLTSWLLGPKAWKEYLMIDQWELLTWRALCKGSLHRHSFKSNHFLDATRPRIFMI